MQRSRPSGSGKFWTRARGLCTAQGGVRWLCREGQTVRQERIENPVGLGMVNKGEGFDGLKKEREERCPAVVSETETSDE